MIATNVKRPRNVNVPRAAAILYGDWGTSKAYVIGLAFAVGGYASFWLIGAMCVLTALVGINYIIICRLGAPKRNALFFAEISSARFQTPFRTKST
jgi:hypothetical protein